MADTLYGYPTSPFERFVTGFQTGWEKMTDLRKKADDLETQLAVNEERRNNAKLATQARSGGGQDSSTTVEEPYATGTTGSGEGGGGGRGGGGSSGDMSQTGDGHVATKAERLNYYNKINEENKWGLNMHAIMQLVGNEGLNKYIGDKNDPAGKSYGDFQLNESGMGKAARAVGIKIDDPNTWQQQGYFAMQQMAQHKNDPNWFGGQWHGPRDKSPWALYNYSNPTAVPPKGMLAYIPSTSAPTPTPASAPTAAPAIGSSTPPPRRIDPTGDYGGSPPLDPTGDYGGSPPAAPAPAASAAPSPGAPSVGQMDTLYQEAAQRAAAGPWRAWRGAVDAQEAADPGGTRFNVPAGAPAAALAPAAPTRAPRAPPAVTSTPGGTNGIRPNAALPVAGPAQVIANELAQRPTFGQLAQLAQQYLPVAKAALMPTNSGLYG